MMACPGARQSFARALTDPTQVVGAAPRVGGRRHGFFARAGLLALAVLAALAVGLAVAARAEAFVYWADTSGGSIGRANTDGSGADHRFIEGVSDPCGVAVDDTHVYWGNQGSGTIGRANLDGSHVIAGFITDVGRACGVAVDDAHVYWATTGVPAGGPGSTIGRANLDGSGADPRFITGASEPCGPAVDDAHIYWANARTNAIGSASLDGSGVDQSFISGASDPCGVAVDGAHVYWANSTDSSGDPGTTIGRANLDGSGADQSFITGASLPCGVAVDEANVYWANASGGSIGRANLDGSGADQSFVTGAGGSCGVAVDSLTLPACSGVATSTPHNVPAAVKLDCSGPGTLTYEVVSQPVHGRISDFDSAAGTLTYTPDAGFTGADSFAYRASNAGGASNIATVTMTVKPPAPTCEDVMVSIPHGRPSAVKLDCSGPGKLTYGVVSTPARGEISGFDAAAGTLTHTPDSGFSGGDGFTYTAVNAGGVAETARVTITVGPSNRFRFGNARRNRRRGTAKLTIHLPGPGTLRLARTKKVRPRGKRVDAADKVRLTVRPRARARKRLRRRGTLRVRPKVIYTPQGGEPRVKRLPLKLKRRVRT